MTKIKINSKSSLFIEKLGSKPKFIIKYGLQIGLIPLLFFFYLASQLSTNPISIEPNFIDTIEIQNELNTLEVRLVNEDDAAIFKNSISNSFEFEFPKSKTVFYANLAEVSSNFLVFQLDANGVNHIVLRGSEKPSIKNKKTFLESIIEIFD